MTRGLVTGAILAALFASLAVPAFAEDCGASPAGEALPSATPPPRVVTVGAPRGVPRTSAVPPPPPPPPAWSDVRISAPPARPPEVAAPAAWSPSREGAARNVGNDAAAVSLQERYTPNPTGDAALEREVVAQRPCVPQGRIVRGWGGDPMKIRDRAQYFNNAYWGFSLSFLPNIGLAWEFGGVYERTSSLIWAWEGEITWQFLDDKIFADDGGPAAGDWYQFQLGVKIASDPDARRHWTVRWGGVWFKANGETNIVEESGNYVGAYLGFGFETDLSCNFTMGPELSGMFVFHEDGRFEVVPQFNWHFIWKF